MDGFGIQGTLFPISIGFFPWKFCSLERVNFDVPTKPTAKKKQNKV
jgi:hypothetical protein